VPCTVFERERHKLLTLSLKSLKKFFIFHKFRTQKSLKKKNIKKSIIRINVLNNKVLWIIFLIFVLFDNIFSYTAVVVFNLREGFPLGAYLVHEISPFFYFIFIPLTLLGVLCLVKLSGWLSVKTGKKQKKNTREISERIALTGIIIAWGVGITSGNLFVMFNRMTPVLAGNAWRHWMTIGVIMGVTYILFESYKLNKSKNE